MTATGVGPYPGPGLLTDGAAGHQYPAGAVEDVAGEPPMQRRLRVMDLRLRQLPDRAVSLVEQDDRSLVVGRSSLAHGDDVLPVPALVLPNQSGPTGQPGLHP